MHSKVTHFTNTAIVVGGGDITGLGAVRALGREGIEVYYIDDKKSIAASSKYCKKYFISSKLSESEEQLKRILLKIKEQLPEKAVLFPASDLYALRLSHMINNGLTGFYFPAPTPDVFESLIDKKKFYQSFGKDSTFIAKTRFPENIDSVESLGKDLSYPVFIKPCLSHVFSKAFDKKGFLAHSNSQLIQYCNKAFTSGIEVMLQEVILGYPTNGVFIDGYMDRKNNVKVLFARQRLRMWPLDFGNSTLCVSIPISQLESLKSRLIQYLKSINYSGIFSAEFKKDTRDNCFKLIEINSRTSGWFNTLSAKCGANIMLTAYLDAIGQEFKLLDSYEANVKLMLMIDDAKASLSMLMKGKLNLKDWALSLRGKTDYSPYAKDDIMPFVKTFLR